MSQPAVTLTVLDGALGVLPPSSGKLYAVVGAADAGPLDTPQTFARVKDAQAVLQGGPLLEAGAHFIERYGRPVLFVRTGNTVDGSYPAEDATVQTGGGTSVVTVDEATTPNDDYEVLLAWVNGGTIGTTGITLRYSLDGGRTMSALIALGTANNYIIPGSGGIRVLFAAGTILAGQRNSFRATAPKWNNTELASALTALRNTKLAFEIVHVVGPIDSDAFDAVELAIAGMHSIGKYVTWLGNTRMPNLAESEATYLGAMTTALGSAKSSILGGVMSGACKLTSSVSGRKYRRPIAYAVAALEASVEEHVNTADVNVGRLVGVSIRDANGNPDEHDESINPGLDDGRFTVLRTWEGPEGIYVNRPRIFAPEGSDFQLVPHRRVMNLALAAWRLYFIRRCNKPVFVDKATGFILEEEALEIEAGALAVARGVLMAKPKASDVLFTLGRSDNLLSTKTMTGQGRVLPLAYPEFINLDVGFLNPALQVVPV